MGGDQKKLLFGADATELSKIDLWSGKTANIDNLPSFVLADGWSLGKSEIHLKKQMCARFHK